MGRVYDAAGLKKALAEAAIGITPSKAIVPLVFTGAGELLSAEQAWLIFNSVHGAASEAEAMVLLDDAGASLHFTTAEVYDAAIGRLKAQGRVSDKEFHAVGSGNTTSLELPSLHEPVVFVFNPYTTISLAITPAELQPAQDPDCMIRCSRRCSWLRHPYLVIPCFLACVALLC